MRVMAAAFADAETSEAVRLRLASELGIRDADIAPYVEGFVLGMRFPDDLDDAASNVVTAAGGTVLVDVPEAWTRNQVAPATTGTPTAVPEAEPDAGVALQMPSIAPGTAPA